MKLLKNYPIPFIFNICIIAFGIFAVIKGKLAGSIFVLFGIIILAIIIYSDKKKTKNPSSPSVRELEKQSCLEANKSFYPIYRQEGFEIGIDEQHNKFVKKEYQDNNVLGYSFSNNFHIEQYNYYKNLIKLAELNDSYLYLNYDYEKELKGSNIIVLPKDKNKILKKHETPEQVFLKFDASKFSEYIKNNYGVEMTSQAIELFNHVHEICVRDATNKKIMLTRNMNEFDLDKEYIDFISNHKCIAYKGDIWDETVQIYWKSDNSIYRVDTHNSQIYKYKEEYPIIFMTHAPTKIESYDKLQEMLVELNLVNKFPNLTKDNWQNYYAYSSSNQQKDD